MAQHREAQLMKWEELTTGRGRVTTNTEGNDTINKGNLPKHIFTLTLLPYAYKATKKVRSQWNNSKDPASTYIHPQKCTFLTDDEYHTTMWFLENNVRNDWYWDVIPHVTWNDWYWDVLPQITQFHYWVVLPQVEQYTFLFDDDKRKVYYWDVLPQITW